MEEVVDPLVAAHVVVVRLALHIFRDAKKWEGGWTSHRVKFTRHTTAVESGVDIEGHRIPLNTTHPIPPPPTTTTTTTHYHHHHHPLPPPLPTQRTWASSLSWCGNLRSTPPEWMSMLLPRSTEAIAEHSMCHPGRPYTREIVAYAVDQIVGGGGKSKKQLPHQASAPHSLQPYKTIQYTRAHTHTTPTTTPPTRPHGDSQ